MTTFALLYACKYCLSLTRRRNAFIMHNIQNKSEPMRIFFHRYRRILKILFFSSIVVTFINVCLIYMDAQKRETRNSDAQQINIPNSEYNLEKYNIRCSTSNCANEKVIFLWTPIQNYFDNWRWGIGPHPVIKDCANADINYKCIISKHPDMIKYADVVLFSIQDMEKVCDFFKITRGDTG